MPISGLYTYCDETVSETESGGCLPLSKGAGQSGTAIEVDTDEPTP